MLLERPSQRRQLISLTPLIDVVFILLLFFMLSSTFHLARQIEIRAAATASKSQAQSKVQKILLQADGKALVNGVIYGVHSAEFTALLEQAADSEDKVTVAALSHVEMQKLVTLLDRVRNAGISDLNLAGSVAP